MASSSLARLAGLILLVLLFLIFVNKIKEPFVSQCPEDSYQTTNSGGSVTCVKCDSGYKQNALDPTKCSPLNCSTGEYAVGSVCKPCPQGQTSEGGNVTQCSPVICNPGEKVVNGQCVPCEDGKTSIGGTVTSCTPMSCQANFTPTNNVCTRCGETQKSDGGVSGCTNLSCPSNFKAVNHQCVPCEQGAYSEGGTSTTCTACPSGNYLKDGVCTACDAGTFAGTTGSTSCKPCAKGTYSEKSASVCLNCGAGTFQDAEGQALCNKCAAGTYQSQTGQKSCIDCPKGKFSDSEGNAYCTSCQRGTYQDATGQKNCIPCPKNTYGSSVGLASCTACPDGYKTDGTGATSISDCKKPISTKDCVNMYSDLGLTFDSKTPSTAKSIFYNLTEDSFTIPKTDNEITATESDANKISKCVLNQRLRDRATLCQENRAMKVDECGDEYPSGSHSLLQAFEFVNSKGICVDRSGQPIPYPSKAPPGTKGSPDSVMGHIVKCTNTSDYRTCTYEYPIGTVMHKENPCTSRNLVYDFDTQQCVDPGTDTVNKTENTCANNQVFDPVTGKCLSVITPIKAMPANTRGTLKSSDYRDCKTIDKGDCTVVYKNKASEDPLLASTKNPCPSLLTPNNTIFNFDTYTCETKSAQGFANYKNQANSGYQLNRPIIA